MGGDVQRRMCRSSIADFLYDGPSLAEPNKRHLGVLTATPQIMFSER